MAGKYNHNVINLFRDKFAKARDQHVTERVARYKGFDKYYLDALIRDASAATGCELVRRIIGIAHVKDITSIKDAQKRAQAEKICLAAGRWFILDRENIKTGEDFMDLVKECEEKIGKGMK